MAYKVNSDTCINCGACESECPNGAISEVNDKRAVASEQCISCGACASVCPVEALAEE